MGRDHLLPPFTKRLSRRQTPVTSIVITVGSIIFFLLAFDPLPIAKLASAFQLLMFALLCLAVIVMRESRIHSYDPGYRSPLYPWMQLFGIIAPLVLIAEMGWLPMAFSIGLMLVGIGWYFWYARKQVARYGAIHHVFERLGRHRYDDLDRELRGILKEKGLRAHDPFFEMIAEAEFIEVDEHREFDDVVEEAAKLFAQRKTCTAQMLAEGFLQGTRTGATPVAGGAALPHLRLRDIDRPMLVMARCQSGVDVAIGDVFGDRRSESMIHAAFFLLSPERDPGQHLRLLAELASRVDRERFLTEWLTAGGERELKAALLRHGHHLSMRIAHGTPAWELAGRPISALDLPRSCLVAAIFRGSSMLVPGGNTVIREGDQVTVIGDERAIEHLVERYGSAATDVSAPVDDEPGAT
jgi:mannitol/fructose-specific phosphotransferase system IIA component (Ntr-type)